LAATVTGRVSVVWDASAISYQSEDVPDMDVESARTVGFRGEERLILRSQLERLTSSAPAREILAAVWPRSVPPGALLVDGRLVGTWRRRGGTVNIQPFESVHDRTRQLVEHEVDTMPLRETMSVTWS